MRRKDEPAVRPRAEEAKRAGRADRGATITVAKREKMEN
jgi:hypothetical protein